MYANTTIKFYLHIIHKLKSIFKHCFMCLHWIIFKILPCALVDKRGPLGTMKTS